MAVLSGCAVGPRPVRVQVVASSEGWLKYRDAVRQWSWVCGEVVIDTTDAPLLREVEEKDLHCPPHAPVCSGVTEFQRTATGRFELKEIRVLRGSPVLVWSHELGHALGADHTTDGGGVMDSPIKNWTRKVNAADCSAASGGKYRNH